MSISKYPSISKKFGVLLKITLDNENEKRENEKD